MAAHDYKAHTPVGLHGCQALRGYSMAAFMQDWVRKKGDPASYRITRSKSCGSGVILNVDLETS